MSDLSTATLVAEAALGRDAEEFLGSDLGRYMLARAEEDERSALDELAEVWPWRRGRIAQLQLKVKNARAFRNYLADLVITGKQALDTLESRE